MATLMMVESNTTMTTPTSRITASLINAGSSGSVSASTGVAVLMGLQSISIRRGTRI